MISELLSMKLFGFFPFPLFVGMGVAFLVFLAVFPRRTSLGGFSYMRGNPVITPGERSMFAYLRANVPNQYHVCPKVRVADIIRVNGSFLDRSSWQTAFNRISSKHVDFAIIDLQGQVQFVIEVDDRSHLKGDRKGRDFFVNDAFGDAGVDIIRVPCNRHKNHNQLNSALELLKADPAQGRLQ